MFSQITNDQKIAMFIVGMNRLKDVIHLNGDTQLFPDLSHKAFLWRFSIFYLAPGEFPFPREGSFFALAKQNLIALLNNGCHNG